MLDPEGDIIASIRMRPAMYVGDVHDGFGLHHLIWEVVGNALDEHLAGFCRRIDVTLHHEGSVSVEDDGRGVSVAPLADGTPLLVAVLTRMHDRATFDGHPKHVHLDGLGLGLVVVSALSDRTSVETTRDGRRYRLELERGTAGPLIDSGPAARAGTRVTFSPDPSIFTRIDFDATRVRERLLQVAAFCPGLALGFTDERRTVFSCPEGLVALLPPKRRASVAHPEVPLHATGEQDGIRVEVALQWASHRWEGRVRSFVNLYETNDGGSHVTGLRRGLAALVPRGAPRRKEVADELRARLMGIISVLHHDPTFDSPTRSKLSNPEVRPIVEAVVRRCLREFAEQRPEEVRRLLADCDPGA